MKRFWPVFLVLGLVIGGIGCKKEAQQTEAPGIGSEAQPASETPAQVAPEGTAAE